MGPIEIPSQPSSLTVNILTLFMTFVQVAQTKGICLLCYYTIMSIINMVYHQSTSKHACQKAHDGCYNFSFYESEIKLTDHFIIKTHAHVKVLYWCFLSSITILFHFLCQLTKGLNSQGIFTFYQKVQNCLHSIFFFLSVNYNYFIYIYLVLRIFFVQGFDQIIQLSLESTFISLSLEPVRFLELTTFMGSEILNSI